MATTASAPAAFDAAHMSPYDPTNLPMNIDSIIKSDQDETNHDFDLSSFPQTGSNTFADAAPQTPVRQIADQPKAELDPGLTMADIGPYQAFDPTDMSMDVTNQVQADLESYAAEEAAAPDQPMQAFAKLQFEDGDFYVNTYAIELGRDMNAMRHERRKKKVEQRKKEEEAREQEMDNSGDVDPSSHSSHSKPKEQNAMSASNVSEAGGIIGANVYSDSEDGERHSRRRKRKQLTSNDSSQSQSIAPANLHNNDLSFTSHLFTDGQAVADGLGDFDSAHFNECQFVPIHPAMGRSMAGISRKHIRIEYNSEKTYWELHVLGRNGIFIGEEFIEQGSTVRLRHASEIYLQGIQMIFKLPDNARDDEEADDSRDSDSPLSSAGSSQLQEDIEVGSAVTSGDEEAVSTTKEPERRVKLKLSLSKRASQSGKDLPRDKAQKTVRRPSKSDKEPSKSTAESDVRPSIEQNDISPDKATPSEPPAVPAADLPAGSVLVGVAPEDIPQKRKGPGRPPKNGVMSKRDEAIIKRKKKELQKAGQEIPPLTELLALARAEAGSTVKKDKTEDGEDDVKQSIEPGLAGSSEGAVAGASGDAKADSAARRSQPSAEGEAAKARRMAKSPSPQKPESEYTEEELKKPQKTYVVLIHDALSNCPSGVMDLQQIYDAIQKMYPYYKYRSQTQGWQSSIRHNLIGSEAFEEAGKIGKGRLWKINTNYPIDKEKKRRAPTPPPERPAYSGSYYNNGQYPYNNQGYPAYRPSPYGTPYGPPTTMPNGARPPAATQKPGTYYSPYATNPGSQTHASPYGPPSRPPYAQPQTQNPANNIQPNANGPRPAGQQTNVTNPAQPAANGQAATPQGPAPQPGQAPQQQSSLGNEETVEEIMTYHRQYVHNFKTPAEQDTARALFRKAVNRHIHPKDDHGPFSNSDEKMLSDHIGIIIARSNAKVRNNQLAAQRGQQPQAQSQTARASPYAPQGNNAQAGQYQPHQRSQQAPPAPMSQPVPHAHAPNPPTASPSQSNTPTATSQPVSRPHSTAQTPANRPPVPPTTSASPAQGNPGQSSSIPNVNPPAGAAPSPAQASTAAPSAASNPTSTVSSVSQPPNPTPAQSRPQSTAPDAATAGPSNSTPAATSGTNDANAEPSTEREGGVKRPIDVEEDGRDAKRVKEA